jgi:hypothetical protein
VPNSLLESGLRSYEKLFGNNKTRLRRGIKDRRMQGEIKKAGLRPFDAEEVGGMSPVMGVTKYLTAGKPDRLGRMIGTETYRNMMKKIGMDKVGDEFAKRYPRIAAHIKPGLTNDPGRAGETLIGREEAFTGANPNTVPVNLNPVASRNLRSTMAHEGTHVAQRLGRGDRFPNDYVDSNNILGYEMNPFEMSANRTAYRYSTGDRATFGQSALKELKEAVEELPAGSPERLRLAQAFLRR